MAKVQYRNVSETFSSSSAVNSVGFLQLELVSNYGRRKLCSENASEEHAVTINELYGLQQSIIKLKGGDNITKIDDVELTFFSYSFFLNFNIIGFTCSFFHLSTLRASMARDKNSFTSSSGSIDASRLDMPSLKEYVSPICHSQPLQV